MSDTAIDKLIQSAKEVGGQAWPLLVKQQLVWGWTNIVFGLLGALACVVAGRSLWRWVHAKIEDSHDADGYVVAGLLGGAALAVVFCICVCAVWNSVPDVLFPEGSALASLLHG